MEHQKSLTNYLKNYLPKQPNSTISPTLFCLITGRKEFPLCFKLAMFLSSQKHIVASSILEQKHCNAIMIWNVLLLNVSLICSKCLFASLMSHELHIIYVHLLFMCYIFTLVISFG